MTKPEDGRTRSLRVDRKRLDIRITEDERAEVITAAHAAGMTVSEWVRTVIARAAKRLRRRE